MLVISVEGYLKLENLYVELELILIFSFVHFMYMNQIKN